MGLEFSWRCVHRCSPRTPRTPTAFVAAALAPRRYLHCVNRCSPHRPRDGHITIVPDPIRETRNPGMTSKCPRRDFFLSRLSSRDYRIIFPPPAAVCASSCSSWRRAGRHVRDTLLPPPFRARTAASAATETNHTADTTANTNNHRLNQHHHQQFR